MGARKQFSQELKVRSFPQPIPILSDKSKQEYRVNEWRIKLLGNCVHLPVPCIVSMWNSKVSQIVSTLLPCGIVKFCKWRLYSVVLVKFSQIAVPFSLDCVSFVGLKFVSGRKLIFGCQDAGKLDFVAMR